MLDLLHQNWETLMGDDVIDFENQLKLAQKDDAAKAFAARPSPEGLSDIGLDALLNRFYEDENPGQGLACTKGCTFCCHQYVGISLPELVILAKFITSNFSDDERQSLIRRIDEVIAKTRGMDWLDRSSTNIDCPLLDPETRRCQAYAARPLTCRGMHSLSREACEAAHEAPGTGLTLPQYEAHKRILRSLAIGLQLGLDKQGAEVAELDMAAALKLVLDDPGYGEFTSDGRRHGMAARFQQDGHQIDHVLIVINNRPVAKVAY